MGRVRDHAAEGSAAEPSREGLLAPVAQLVIFGRGVFHMVRLAAAIVEAIAPKVTGSANWHRGTIALNTRWGTHLLDHIVELHCIDTGSKFLKPGVHLGVAHLLSLLLRVTAFARSWLILLGGLLRFRAGSVPRRQRQELGHVTCHGFHERVSKFWGHDGSPWCGRHPDTGHLPSSLQVHTLQ